MLKKTNTSYYVKVMLTILQTVLAVLITHSVILSHSTVATLLFHGNYSITYPVLLEFSERLQLNIEGNTPQRRRVASLDM